MTIFLALNCGSSSIKYAAYQAVPGQSSLSLIRRGLIEGSGPESIREALSAASPQEEQGRVRAVGHRVVHGGLNFEAPVAVDESVFTSLDQLSPLAPLHQPIDLKGVQIAQALFPQAAHIAVFDTAFHRHHAFVHDAYAIPRRFFEAGIRRYGFHGISYEYVRQKLYEDHPNLAAGRVMVAHLGSGASLCAMKAGQSISSSMGFSALDGLPMGSRSGQIDPGVLLYLMQQEQMTANDLSDLLYKESGLKGLSGLSSDMRVLLASEAPQAREAIDYFTHRCAMEIAAHASAIGGLDALVFTAGVGAHSSEIRARIVAQLSWLGLSLDTVRNNTHQTVISSAASTVKLLVLPTDEEAMLALHACRLTQSPSTKR